MNSNVNKCRLYSPKNMEIDILNDSLAILTELSNQHEVYLAIKSLVYLQYGLLQTHGRISSS